MNTKTNNLNQLFEEWEQAIPEYKGYFVKDGIINESCYEQTTPKILFIAKEANHDNAPKPGDYRVEWTAKHFYPFNYRIAEWAYGILNDFPPIDKIFTDTNWEEIYSSALQKIAFINVKKMGGGGRADHSIIYDHIKKNKQFLLKQIEIIDPNIIICSLVDINLVKLLFDVPNNGWTESGYIRKIFKWKTCKVIDFYHPSSMNTPAASYSLLQNIYCSPSFNNL